MQKAPQKPYPGYRAFDAFKESEERCVSPDTAAMLTRSSRDIRASGDEDRRSREIVMDEASTDPTYDEVFGFQTDWSDSNTDEFSARQPVMKAALVDRSMRAELIDSVKREMGLGALNPSMSTADVHRLERKFESLLELKLSALESKLDNIQRITSLEAKLDRILNTKCAACMLAIQLTAWQGLVPRRRC